MTTRESNIWDVQASTPYEAKNQAGETVKQYRSYVNAEIDRLREENTQLRTAVLHYKHWFGDDCMCDEECPIHDALTIAKTERRP